jgi:hypothetical protein
MRFRDRVKVWLNYRRWIPSLYLRQAVANDKRLMEEEFDKVEGSGLGTLRRKDGSVLVRPLTYAGMDDVIRWDDWKEE